MVERDKTLTVEQALCELTREGSYVQQGAGKRGGSKGVRLTETGMVFTLG